MAGSAGVSPRALPLLRQAPFAWLCALAAVGAVALGAAAAWRRRRARGELVRVGSVSELFIYPVKSCRGVSVQRAEVTRMGLRKGDLRDRCWTVIKEDGRILSAKQEPRLVLVSVTCESGHLTLSAPGMKTLSIPVKLPITNSIYNCRRFGVHAEGRDCGDEAAQWITTFLNSKPYRMVHYETDMKTRKPVSFLPLFQPTDEVAYAEASPILLISEASLQDLNARLEKKIRITNFRPNIVVTGCASYEEDTWVEISIGQVRLKGRMCCPRCIFTKVDPDTGIMDKKEPLKTLKSYRKCDPSEQHAFKNDPPFGWLYGVDKTGTIQVGDPVYKIIC
ncbi:PREDICTED: mitochondrial amidoxime-reducing component 1-like isoform X1 [Gekko japonicus]|uniref:Mitochondrial amidoxime-reducing component 1-like isoform X1 n=1 Tax=Gekko japonicus TaxID=146911 RepID=A0ABM1L4H5_GEKJA|nr:PREDICTED: mitochondrial amidoxime-reducing component 1-like isoform X1 [Gekko japonicus]